MTVGPGQILADKYRLLSLLGQGGMGSVWRADHLALNSPVAVKIIDPALTDNPEALARFMREAQSAAALRSPHVVQILDYGMDRNIPYIVMEMLEGESLAHRLARVRKLGLAQTALVLTDVCRAVGRAHQAGVVHRDLKPDNIFIVSNEESEIAKVLDFGIAKSAMPNSSPGSGTRTGAMLGTPYYMSPEQASGSKTVDWRTDLWALGIIAFECITGVRPFVAETLGGLVLAICTESLPAPSSMAPVPPAIDDWFARATRRDREQRFQSAKELIAALRVACGVDQERIVLNAVTASPSSAAQPPLRAFVTTTGASALSRTGPAVPEVPRSSRVPMITGIVVSTLSLGAMVFAWRVISTSEAADLPSPNAGAHALSSPVALPKAVPATVAAAVPVALQVTAPAQAAPAVSASAAPTADRAVTADKARAAADPRVQAVLPARSERAPQAPTVPIAQTERRVADPPSLAATPPSPPEVASHPTAAPASPTPPVNTNTDPLGI